MNVVYSSSDSYSEICGISLVSLLNNNTQESNINIYIIENNISSKNKDKLQQVANEYSRELFFVTCSNLEELIGTKIDVGRWNIGTFFRLFLGSILPKSVEKVMYFDCDTIIRSSLSEIYNLDLTEFSVAGVDDCRCNLYRVDIGSPINKVYINNGFLLINLNTWRKKNYEMKFTEYIKNRKGNITYMDQGVLNGVLGPKNEIFEISPIYNAQRIFFDFTYKDLMRLRKPEYHLTETEYDSAINTPVIVHFTPTFLTGTRPWNIKDTHKYTLEYKQYKVLSPWVKEPLKKDDRKLSKKIMTIICRLLPSNIMIFFMSYFHSKWYPKKRIKQSKTFKL